MLWVTSFLPGMMFSLPLNKAIHLFELQQKKSSSIEDLRIVLFVI